MTKEVIQKKIDKNRDLIERLINSDLDLGIIRSSVKLTAKNNEVLIEKLNNI